MPTSGRTKVTSPKIAKLASKQLRRRSTARVQKRVAGSDLAQAGGKKGKGIKK